MTPLAKLVHLLSSDYALYSPASLFFPRILHLAGMFSLISFLQGQFQEPAQPYLFCDTLTISTFFPPLVISFFGWIFYPLALWADTDLIHFFIMFLFIL